MARAPMGVRRYIDGVRDGAVVSDAVNITTSIGLRSSGVSQLILPGSVCTILPIIASGTP